VSKFVFPYLPPFPEVLKHPALEIILYIQNNMLLSVLGKDSAPARFLLYLKQETSCFLDVLNMP